MSSVLKKTTASATTRMERFIKLLSTEELSYADLDALLFGPAEGREQIFKLCFENFSYLLSPKIPNLLEGLKTDQLFDEALAAFSKYTTFRINWEDTRGELLPPLVIQNLQIRFNYQKRPYTPSSPKPTVYYLSQGLVADILPDALNIKKLYLELPQPPLGEHNLFDGEEEAFKKILACLGKIPKLEKLTLILGRPNDHKICNPALRLGYRRSPPWFDYRARWKDFHIREWLDSMEQVQESVSKPVISRGPVQKLGRLDSLTLGQYKFFKAIEKGFGFAGEFVDSSSPEVPWEQFEFVWKAKFGETLVWTPKVAKIH